MPNTFGPAPSPGGGTPAQYPLYDPRHERAWRRRFLRPDIPELRLANSLFTANGKWPSRGWILLRRADYNNINPYATSLQLSIDDLQAETPPLTFGKLTIIQARCVSRGNAADPNAVYLVEITDHQGVLWNPWFQFPTTSQYNVRSPAYPQQYYQPSTNAGTAWTWNLMCQDLWNQMPLLGTYPGLPAPATGFSVTESAEGWAFPGASAWEALNAVLDHLGCTVSTDLTQSSPYAIVYGGAADATFTAQQAKYQNLLEEDLEYLDTGSGRVPGKVVVMFHRRNDQYGTEETVRRDNLQWSSTPLYQVTVAAPALFASAAGTHYLWSEFTVRYDVDGNPLAADVTTANAVAQERATQYFARIYRQTAGYMRQTYAGTIPFVTGSQVDGVAWRQDFRDRARQGWQTHIVRGPYPAWPEVGIEPGFRGPVYPE